MVPQSLNVANSDGGSQVLLKDSERVFHRGWRLDDDGKQRAVLLIAPAADHPSRLSLERLKHESSIQCISFRRFLHDQAKRNGDGVVDMPVHHPCSWGQAVGGSERASGRRISVHAAGGQRLMNCLQSAYPAAEPNAGIARDSRRPLACRRSKQSHPLKPDP